MERESPKKKSAYTTIWLNREIYNLLVRAKEMTFSKSFNDLFKKMEFKIKDFALMSWASYNDLIFEAVKAENPEKNYDKNDYFRMLREWMKPDRTDLDIVSRLNVHPATED